MKSSDLKETIKIYEFIDGTTEFGRTDNYYQFKCQTRARVNYISGDRTMDNDEIFYSVNRTFIVRSYVNVAYTDVIEYDGDYWQVTSVDKIHAYNDIVITTVRLNDGVRIKPIPTPTGVISPTGIITPTGIISPTGTNNGT